MQFERLVVARLRKSERTQLGGMLQSKERSKGLDDTSAVPAQGSFDDQIRMSFVSLSFNF